MTMNHLSDVTMRSASTEPKTGTAIGFLGLVGGCETDIAAIHELTVS